MRFVSCRYRNRITLGIVREDRIALLSGRPDSPDSMLTLIDAGPSLWQRLQQDAPELARSAETLPLAEAELLAPIPRPRKNILCLGLNYRDHAQESARAKGAPLGIPTDAVVFTKNVTSVSGPHSDIPAHATVTHELDWEVELGVIIGVGGRAIPRSRALEHVFGYTVVNDVSARDLQFRHKQFFLGKSLDGSCPMGPWIVTRDEIPDPQNLALRCRVNGTLKQNGHTRDMIFDVATIIEVLSRGMTLEPGDIISTGTPAGVGFARTPPEYLKPGDLVECEIEGIGTLRNRVL